MLGQLTMIWLCNGGAGRLVEHGNLLVVAQRNLCSCSFWEESNSFVREVVFLRLRM